MSLNALTLLSILGKKGESNDDGGGGIIILLLGFVCLILVIGAIVFIRMRNQKAATSAVVPPKLGTIVSSTTTKKPDGSTVTVTKDTKGNTQTTTVQPNGTSTTTTQNAQGQTTSSTSNANLAQQLLSNPLTYETMAAQLLVEVVIKSPQIYAKLGKAVADRSAKRAVESAARATAKDSERLLQGTGTKLGANAAEKAGQAGADEAGEKALQTAAEEGTALAGEAEAAADTGPAAPFVEAAELAFNMFTGAMDGLNLGGFQNATNMAMINSMKSEIDSDVKEALSGSGDYPLITGPFDTASPDAFQAALTTAITTIYTQKIADIQAGWNNGTIPKLPATATKDDYTNYFNVNIDMDAVTDAAMSQYCGQLNGTYMKHPTSSNMYCSYTQSQCSAPWPLQNNETYYEWSTADKACEIKPSAMRTYCDGLGLGVTYNIQTGVCNLSDQYCGRYGADGGLKNGDCAYSKGEQIAEMIFGTTLTRSLVNIFSPKNYAPCPPGSEPPVGLAVAAGIGVGAATAGAGTAAAGVGAYAIESMLCQSDNCPAGQDKINGICYPSCPSGFSRKADSFGNEVNGMCYACPSGFAPSTAGLCATDSCTSGLEAGTGIGIGFCYPACPSGQSDNGAAQCAKNCPPGYDTMVATCYRNPVTVTDGGSPSACPSGWKDLGAGGPADLCQPSCPSGQKQMGALCYDNAVNNLSYVPSYSCPSGYTNTGLLCSKYTPISCHQVENGHVGCCWISCSPTHITQCSGGGTTTVSATQAGCNPGYDKVAGVCWATAHPLPTSQSKLSIGVCPSDRDKIGGMCYKQCSDSSWGAGPGFSRDPGTGSCLKPADTIARNPTPRANPVPKARTVPATTVGPQAPLGISLHIFPRPRNAPFPSTSDSDFKNSVIGSHIQQGIDAAKAGDIAGVGRATAATMIVTNPAVLALQAAPLANMAVTSSGLEPPTAPPSH